MPGAAIRNRPRPCKNGHFDASLVVSLERAVVLGSLSPPPALKTLPEVHRNVHFCMPPGGFVWLRPAFPDSKRKGSVSPYRASKTRQCVSLQGVETATPCKEIRSAKEEACRSAGGPPAEGSQRQGVSRAGATAATRGTRAREHTRGGARQAAPAGGRGLGAAPLPARRPGRQEWQRNAYW